MTALLLQTKDPVLSSPKMRQALAHAIDYKQLAAAVTEGLAQPNNSIVPLVSPYHDAVQMKGWDYDPAAAQKLLKEAGYKGQELSILTTKRYPQSYNSAVIVQAMLQSVGINAQHLPDDDVPVFRAPGRGAELRDGDGRQGQATAQGLGQPGGREAGGSGVGRYGPCQAAGGVRPTASAVPGGCAEHSAL
ncbi:hypothetical protein G6F31_017839 [Rhizopus arrhizus]|nr:hypothetical protein G6F31_017839 [Rhizopus arrhizus]